MARGLQQSPPLELREWTPLAIPRIAESLEQAQHDLLVFGSTVWYVAVDQGIPEGSIIALSDGQIVGVIQRIAETENAALLDALSPEAATTSSGLPAQEPLTVDKLRRARAVFQSSQGGQSVSWSRVYDPTHFGELLPVEESRLCQTIPTDAHEAVPDDTQLDWAAWNAKVEAVLQEWESQQRA